MKIGFVYDAVYPWEKGGAQKRVWEIARRLAETHDVHLFGMKYWEGPSVIEREGVTLHGVCDPPELYVDGRRSIYQALYFTAHVTPALLKERFDVIDCQEFPYFPVLSSKLHEATGRSELVVTWYEVWDDYWYEYLGQKGVVGKALERVTARLPDRIVTISDLIQEDLETIGRREKVSTVPNGVDFDRLQSVPAAAEDWDVVYVGRLAEHKNVDLLLDAVAEARTQLPELRVGIIGDGPEREALERHARDVGVADAVEFLGFIEADEEMLSHLAAADLFALPSTREGFPNTILEANACGVPSIVIDHPENGARDVVLDGETGLIVEYSSEQLADAICDLLTDSARHEEMQTAATDFAERHDWSNIAGELEEVYHHAVA